MGLIAAAITSATNVLGEQWKEYFYCDALPADVLVSKGQKKTSGILNSNKASDNIITSGSGIAVADGQCMIIVEDGKIVEFCAEPGNFTWDASTEPSLFNGKLGEGLLQTFAKIGERITYGGVTNKDQRIYYFNTRELTDNKFGTQNPIMFRVVDRNIGLDLDTAVRCSGVYSYRLTDPLLFYSNVCGNVSSTFTRQEIDNQLKVEFVSALQPAMAKIAQMEIRPSELPLHTEELSKAMNETLSAKWGELRGIEVVNVALNPVTIPEEDAAAIKAKQLAATNKDAAMAAATLTQAQANAMEAAANNTGGAANAFYAMNMAQQAGGVNANQLYQQAAAQPQAPVTVTQPETITPAAATAWTCPNCGQSNTGKFCGNCGTAKPSTDWTCPNCGTANKGNFCSNCGNPKA